MKKVIIIIPFLFFCACSTKYVKVSAAIDPRNISDAEQIRLQKALKENGNFRVVDRGEGFQASVNEQDLTQVKMADRFQDDHKAAKWKHLHGADLIIRESHKCSYQYFPFIILSWHQDCDVTLQLVDSSTGEVIAIGEDNEMWIDIRAKEFEGNYADAVDDLVDNIPDNFETEYELDEYKKRNLAGVKK